MSPFKCQIIPEAPTHLVFIGSSRIFIYLFWLSSLLMIKCSLSVINCQGIDRCMCLFTSYHVTTQFWKLGWCLRHNLLLEFDQLTNELSKFMTYIIWTNMWAISYKQICELYHMNYGCCYRCGYRCSIRKWAQLKNVEI